MFLRKCLDLGVVPDIKDLSGSFTGPIRGRLTLPPEQHMPGLSPLNLLALQCEHIMFIGPIFTVLSSSYV